MPFSRADCRSLVHILSSHNAAPESLVIGNASALLSANLSHFTWQSLLVRILESPAIVIVMAINHAPSDNKQAKNNPKYMMAETKMYHQLREAVEMHLSNGDMGDLFLQVLEEFSHDETVLVKIRDLYEAYYEDMYTA